jgi:hypothetical protein
MHSIISSCSELLLQQQLLPYRCQLSWQPVLLQAAARAV